MSGTSTAQNSQNVSQTPPSPKLGHPETTNFQILFTTYDVPMGMTRDGRVTTDLDACLATAQEIIERRSVKEVFVCTVHAAYTKETTVKKVI